jgi:uncharacterized membrane protein YqiK
VYDTCYFFIAIIVIKKVSIIVVPILYTTRYLENANNKINIVMAQKSGGPTAFVIDIDLLFNI